MMLSLDTAYRSFGGEVEASSTPTICRLSDSRRHQLSAIARLLPHTNSVAHRASGAWVHIAPTIQGDIKEWFEGAGWTHAEDWPKVAQAIFRLVASCADDPQSLETACAEFAAMPYTKGLQTGQ